MNRLLIERWPERVKRLYKKYYPEDKDVTYGNLLEKVEEAIGEKEGIELISTKVGVGTVPFANILSCIQSELIIRSGE